MNSFGPWWDATITIFNRFEDPQTQVVTWYRTVLYNNFWQSTGNKVVIGNVVLDTNSIICRIPKNDKFLEKQDWVATPNDEMSKYFTLGEGDIIVKGEVTDDINEYQTGHRSSDLLKKYKGLQGCMEIQQWSNNTGHRGNEHYYARGK